MDWVLFLCWVFSWCCFGHFWLYSDDVEGEIYMNFWSAEGNRFSVFHSHSAALNKCLKMPSSGRWMFLFNHNSLVNTFLYNVLLLLIASGAARAHWWGPECICFVLGIAVRKIPTLCVWFMCEIVQNLAGFGDLFCGLWYLSKYLLDLIIGKFHLLAMCMCTKKRGREELPLGIMAGITFSL